MNIDEHIPLNRRAFLAQNALCLAALNGLHPLASYAETEVSPELRIGMVTDLHYADKKPAGSRYYRETLNKLNSAADKLKHVQPDFIVELGDFIDAADSVKEEMRYLQRVNKVFGSICQHRHYVLGNHCVHTLKKNEFLDGVEKDKSYYSFDVGSFHFVVLDSCFRSDNKPYGRKNFQWTDPNIPKHELDWLAQDLNETKKNTVVFAHQRLDVSNHYGVNNSPAVRKILENSKNVLAVFQGHSHKNDYNNIQNIHYCTMVAMVEGSGIENNAFSTLEIFKNGSMKINGFKKQKNYSWNRV